MTGLFYGLAMLGAFALALGGLWMWRRNRLRAILLLLVAAITLFNVWSWSTLPLPENVAGRPNP
ncbi:hypothetical protein [Sandaracinobacter sp.]|uniref:hypothetical protein n=1 Tax=Sandaracinobacter sp. TaxID=2487581 RepID=UPI0035B01A8E